MVWAQKERKFLKPSFTADAQLADLPDSPVDQHQIKFTRRYLWPYDGPAILIMPVSTADGIKCNLRLVH
jgi:hypothetical protein